MILITGNGELANALSNQIKCDIVSLRYLSNEEISNLLPKYEIIIHNAANLVCNTLEEAVDDNFILTKRIIDLIIVSKKNIQFIYISSMSFLHKENKYKNIDEMTNYAFSKYLGEIYALKSQIKNVICIRFSTIFYANKDKDGLSNLIFNAKNKKEITIFNNGISKRDFIPLMIAVNYIKLIVSKKINGHQIFNLASGNSISFAKISKLLLKLNPTLTIKNENTQNNNPVLHQFDINKLNEIGILDFNLENYIIDFHKSIDKK